MSPNDERLTVSLSMQKHGGSFVKQLGFALIYADDDNCRKIKQTFPEYWEKYLELGVEDAKSQSAG